MNNLLPNIWTLLLVGAKLVAGIQNNSLNGSRKINIQGICGAGEVVCSVEQYVPVSSSAEEWDVMSSRGTTVRIDCNEVSPVDIIDPLASVSHIELRDCWIKKSFFSGKFSADPKPSLVKITDKEIVVSFEEGNRQIPEWFETLKRHFFFKEMGGPSLYLLGILWCVVRQLLFVRQYLRSSFVLFVGLTCLFRRSGNWFCVWLCVWFVLIIIIESAIRIGIRSFARHVLYSVYVHEEAEAGTCTNN